MDVSGHIFANNAFLKIITDAIDFLDSSTFYELPPQSAFYGSGVYALYYSGEHKLYKPLNNINVSDKRVPIYVGKAVPPGWRQGREENSKNRSLYLRLRQHSRTIETVDNLELGCFQCRFIILNGEESDLISPLESRLINLYKPIWNSCVDGFGNHDPGKGRYEQARSEWDTLHPGRGWAKKLHEHPSDLKEIFDKSKRHFEQGF